MKRILVLASLFLASAPLWAGSLTISAPAATAPAALSQVQAPSFYGGINGNADVTLSSAVPSCEEWISAVPVNISSVSFRESTSMSSHVAVGFYDSTCTKLTQSTATLVNGTITALFNPVFSMAEATKYFICIAVDGNAINLRGAINDGGLANQVNNGEPATNFHIFTAGNSSTVNGVPTVVLPTTCGTRTDYGQGAQSVVGYYLH